MGRITGGIIVACALSLPASRGDEPALGRVVEGKIVSAGGPVRGARVLFGPPERGFVFVEGASATTDARGHYRADLSGSPWSSGPTRVLVLAPGFGSYERTLEAGRAAVTLDAMVEPQPWRETELRTEDGSGRAVAGVPIACRVGGASWSTHRSDEAGRCRVAMAPAIFLEVRVVPEWARPIEVGLAGSPEEPPSITLPILPPLRGRVVDSQGRPVPEVGVGRWVVFWKDGRGEVLPFWDGARAVTDREGAFSIAPTLAFRGDQPAKSRESWVHALCFADPLCRRIAMRTFTPTRPSEPMEVVLAPTRAVRIPIAWGSLAFNPASVLSATISVSPRPGLDLFLISRHPRSKGGDRGQADGMYVEEYLPEGTYRLEADLSDAKTEKTLASARREFAVPAGEGPLELAALELEPPRSEEMSGKLAPEIEATELETGRPARLSDFRGKVVVLDFWGYWCGPCIWSMPHLADLQRKYVGRPLVVVALHDGSARDRAEYERKTATARERIWGGRDLPLKVLLDQPDPNRGQDDDRIGSGATISRYGITGFPTLFVIDHGGTLVGQVGHREHDRLEALVRGLVEKAEAK